MTRQDTYQRITDTILAELERGTVPWRKPWVSVRPVSASTGKPYRGLNVLLLSTAGMRGAYELPYWGTYKRLRELGGQVRRGQRGTLVTFWKLLDVADRETDERKRVPLLKLFTVFNVGQADWSDGVPARFVVPAPVDPIAEAERAVAGYLETGPELRHGGDRAFYRPKDDLVQLPARDWFTSADGYYATMYHELTHSTGHASRLDRPGIAQVSPFGAPNYSREELVAELGAAMLAASVGLDTSDLIANSASYVHGWIQALTHDPRAIVWASGQAQKAADFVLGAERADG